MLFISRPLFRIPAEKRARVFIELCTWYIGKVEEADAIPISGFCNFNIGH